jgi:hypothetical protein
VEELTCEFVKDLPHTGKFARSVPACRCQARSFRRRIGVGILTCVGAALLRVVIFASALKLRAGLSMMRWGGQQCQPREKSIAP